MSTLVSPATGSVTSNYGPRRALIPGMSTYHRGVDIARGSTKIVSPTDGIVVASAYAVGRGNYVQIDHGDGVRTLHQHLAARHVAKGVRVTAGQSIGIMGRTGLVTGVHLHTEVTVNGAIVNPSTWYAARGVRLATDDHGTLPTSPASSSSSVLSIGSTGGRVGRLQSGLRKTFPAYRRAIPLKNQRLIVVDNSFGPETDAWVREFQRRTGITIDGIVGPQTVRELAKYGITL